MDSEIKIYTAPTTEILRQIEIMHNDNFPLSLWSKSYFKKFFAKKERLPILCILVQKKRICGYMLGKIDEKKNGFLIHSFLVSENFRRKGWGKKLMRSAVDFVSKNSEMKNIVVRFRGPNPAQNFYKAFGFSDPQICTNYENGERKISMKLAI